MQNGFKLRAGTLRIQECPEAMRVKLGTLLNILNRQKWPSASDNNVVVCVAGMIDNAMIAMSRPGSFTTGGEQASWADKLLPQAW